MQKFISLLIGCCLLVACKEETPVNPLPMGFIDSFRGSVISQLNDEGVAEVPILFQAYYTGTFGRAYLSDTTVETDANGEFVAEVRYVQGQRQAYADSIDADSADLFYNVSLQAPFAVMQSLQSDGSPIAPNNAQLDPNLTMNFEVLPLVTLPIELQDTTAGDYVVELFVRELFPVKDTFKSGSSFPQNLSTSATLPLIQGREMEVRQSIFEVTATSDRILDRVKNDTLILMSDGAATLVIKY